MPPQERPLTGTDNRALNRTVTNCVGDICSCLINKINEYTFGDRTTTRSGTKGLGDRFAEQLGSTTGGPGTAAWANHDAALRDQQAALKRHLDEYASRNCGPPPPPAATELARRPLPTPEDWQAEHPGLSPARMAGGAAAAVGIGYFVYRTVRMIPSLFAWPTIPLNLAVP